MNCDKLNLISLMKSSLLTNEEIKHLKKVLDTRLMKYYPLGVWNHIKSYLIDKNPANYFEKKKQELISLNKIYTCKNLNLMYLMLNKSNFQDDSKYYNKSIDERILKRIHFQLPSLKSTSMKEKQICYSFKMCKYEENKRMNFKVYDGDVGVDFDDNNRDYIKPYEIKLEVTALEFVGKSYYRDFKENENRSIKFDIVAIYYEDGISQFSRKQTLTYNKRKINGFQEGDTVTFPTRAYGSPNRDANSSDWKIKFNVNIPFTAENNIDIYKDKQTENPRFYLFTGLDGHHDLGNIEEGYNKIGMYNISDYNTQESMLKPHRDIKRILQGERLITIKNTLKKEIKLLDEYYKDD